MKPLLVLGLILMLLGSGLMIAGAITWKDTDPVIKELGIEKTTTKRRPIPIAVSGTVLGVGAVLTVIGATKSRK